MELSAKVFALGNSNAIRFPQIVMEALSLKTDDPILMEITDSEVRIRKKVFSEPYPSIKTLFAGYNGDYHPVEMDAADGVGREMI